MASSAGDRVDALLLAARLGAAVRFIGAGQAESPSDLVSFRRLSAGVFALAGREREIAGVADPRLLICKSHAEVRVYLTDATSGSASHDYLAAGVVLTWSADAAGAYRCFNEAHDRAVAESNLPLAVGAKERLAHHAMVFGDVATARAAIEEAIDLAVTHRLAQWRLRCMAQAARLALECDDAARSGELLAQAAAEDASPDLTALFAPAGVRLALRQDDHAALHRWTSAEILETALNSIEIDSALAATTACLFAAAHDEPPLGALTSLALRRALVFGEPAPNAVELYTLAARCGDADDARLGVDSLRAAFAPRRRYIEAHFLLARAYALARTGDRPGAMSSAGDAARAFDALGLRQWTNDSMLLLVHHDGVASQQSRRRPTALSLTRREEQVAHLISRGASNREVARTLQISEHTVERHVSSILSRLGLRSRWQIVDRRIASAQD